MENQRIVFTVPKEMHEVFRRHVVKRGATQAGILRILIAEWLEQQGEKVESQVEWGGARKETGEGSES